MTDSEKPSHKLFSIFAPRVAASTSRLSYSTASASSEISTHTADTPSLASTGSTEAMSESSDSDYEELMLVPFQSQSRPTQSTSARPRRHKAEPATSQSTTTVISSDSDDDLPDEHDLTVLSSRLPTSSKSNKRRSNKTNGDYKTKKRKRQSEVIVIDDSPVKSATTFAGFALMSSTFDKRKTKRKQQEPQLPPWPTADEHLAPSPRPSSSSSTAAPWSNSRKGKQRADDLFSESTIWNDITRQEPVNASMPDIPVPVQLSLDDIDQYMPSADIIRANALIERLARSAKQAHLATRPRPSSGPLPHELWTQKYGPRSADEVLGNVNRKNARALRDWLKDVAVSANRGQNLGGPSSGGAKRQPRTVSRRVEKPAKKKASKNKTLDGWIVDSDEEDVINDAPPTDDEDDQDSQQVKERPSSSLFPSLRNVMLLVGPQGTGKTAAVQAVAHELGWDIFEVNAGMGKRSPSHIERLVGDVGRNHIVRAGASPSKSKNPFSFAAAAAKAKRQVGAAGDDNASSSARDKQKESLILVEEVDVLFKDETSSGWYAGLANLVENSRRPIVLTSNYDADIDYDKLTFQHIVWTSDTEPAENLTFEAVEPDLAASYLQLVALNEGHLIDTRQAHALYDGRSILTGDASIGADRGTPYWFSTGGLSETPQSILTSRAAVKGDLRQAIMQLQFECQWGSHASSGWQSKRRASEWPMYEPATKAANWYAKWSDSTAARDVPQHADDDHTAAQTAEIESYMDACLDSVSLKLETYEGGPLFNKHDDEVIFRSLPHPAHPREPAQLEVYDRVRSIQEAIRELSGTSANDQVEERLDALNKARTTHDSTALPFVFDVFSWSHLMPRALASTDFMPSIRLITEAEIVRTIAGESEDVAGRRLRKSTRASAYEPLLAWRDGQAGLILSTKFEDVEQAIDTDAEAEQGLADPEPAETTVASSTS